MGVLYGDFLAAGGTQDEMAAALRASGVTWQFRYELLDQALAVIGAARCSACTVTNNDLAQVKRTATVTMDERDASQVNFFTDRLRPVASALVAGTWVDFRMGVFIMSAPTSNPLGPQPGTRSITCQDLGQILNADQTVNVVSLAAGTGILAAVSGVLEGAGIPDGQIQLEVDAAATLPTAMEWDIGTPKLTVINALLTAVGYRSLYFDRDGQATAVPYVPAAQAPVAVAYSALAPDGVIVDASPADTLNLAALPNVFVGIAASPDLDASGNPINLRAGFTNDSPRSPISTVNTDRKVTQVYQMTGIVSQAALAAAVQAAAENVSSQYEELDFDSALMPIHGEADVLTVDLGSGPQRFRQHGWTFPLDITQPMHHLTRRTVELTSS